MTTCPDCRCIADRIAGLEAELERRDRDEPTPLRGETAIESLRLALRTLTSQPRRCPRHAAYSTPGGQ